MVIEVGQKFTAKKRSGSIRKDDICTVKEIMFDKVINARRICIDKGAYALTEKEFADIFTSAKKENRMWRVTFHNGPEGSERMYKHDCLAKDSDEALHVALSHYKRKHGYDAWRDFSDATTEECPTEACPIGIRFEYKGTNGDSGYQYLFIFADCEMDAEEYYNKNIKGKKFFQPWPHKIDDEGNCTYGSIASTYFAAGTHYDFDATKEKESNKNVKEN